MKILLVLGLFIVFIAVFFVLFVSDMLLKNYIECNSESGVITCDLGTIELPFFYGIFMIAAFIVVAGVAIHLIAKTLLSPQVHITESEGR